MPSDRQSELRLLEYSLQGYLDLFRELAALGKRRFLVCGLDRDAAQFVAAAKQFDARCTLRVQPDGDEGQFPLASAGNAADGAEIDAVFCFDHDARQLSRRLVDFVDFRGLVCAPITAHYCRNRAVFINSIPKSGTHLLFECVRAFGFKDPPYHFMPDYDDDIEPGRFYNLEHMLTDHLARPYSRFGKFVDAFCGAVVLFVYRDPRDVAVSYAHFLASPLDYHILRTYMHGLSPEDRLSAVLRGEYPIPVFLNRDAKLTGTIRDLTLLYADWLRYPFPNLIPLRFEDLVGPQGGGDADAQLRTVWKLQLALHVPGKPTEFSDKIFSNKSATFRKGQIGSYLEEFTANHIRFFRSLPQDFMQLYGYGAGVEVVEPFVLWLTGRSGSGKTPLAQALAREFALTASVPLQLLDDEQGMLDAAAAAEGAAGARRTDGAELAATVERLVRQGQPVCVSARLPLRKSSAGVKAAVKFLQVQVTCPQEAGEARDAGGAFPSTDAVRCDSPSDTEGVFEEPCFPDLRIEMDRGGVKKSVQTIIARLAELGYLRMGHATVPGKRALRDYFTGSIEVEQAPYPLLIERDYWGYNIVRCRGKCYALALALGPTDLTRVDDGTLEAYQAQGQCLIADSLDGARRLVDHVVSTPKLVEEGYEGYNIVRYRGKYYALAQVLGSVDLRGLTDYTLTEYQAQGRCFVGGSLEEAKSLVSQALSQALQEARVGRERIVASLRQELDVGGDPVANLQRELAERDRAVASLQQELAESDRARAALQQQLDSPKSIRWWQITRWIHRR